MFQRGLCQEVDLWHPIYGGNRIQDAPKFHRMRPHNFRPLSYGTNAEGTMTRVAWAPAIAAPTYFTSRRVQARATNVTF